MGPRSDRETPQDAINSAIRIFRKLAKGGEPDPIECDEMSRRLQEARDTIQSGREPVVDYVEGRDDCY